MDLSDNDILKWENGKDYFHKYEFTNKSRYRKYPDKGLSHVYYITKTDLVYWEVYINEKSRIYETVFIKSYPFLSLSPVTTIELNSVSYPDFFNCMAWLRLVRHTKDIFGGVSFYKINTQSKYYKESSNAEVYASNSIPCKSDEKAFTVYSTYYNDIYGYELHKAYRFIRKLIDIIEIHHQIMRAKAELNHVNSPLHTIGENNKTISLDDDSKIFEYVNKKTEEDQ